MSDSNMKGHNRSVAFCFMILASTTTYAQSAKGQVQLWHAGFMHANEVKGKTGQRWYGLFETESSFQLRAVKVTVLDSSDGLDDKFVGVDSDTLPIFLIRGIDHLRTGSVKTVFFGNLHLDPDQYATFEHQPGGEYYGLAASGKKDGEVLHDYQLIFYNGRIKQPIYKRNPAYSEGALSLLWAGDLDGDGKLDLLLDLANHYNASEPTLFLSSPAEAGKLVKKVASYVSIGC